MGCPPSNATRHRRWMLYSFAMATSFVWGLALGLIFTKPALFPTSLNSSAG
jgi:hypothetical protein